MAKIQHTQNEIFLKKCPWMTVWHKCPVHSIFCFLYFGHNNEKQKNQLYCLCLKMTVDFRNFVDKNDVKWNKQKCQNRTFKVNFWCKKSRLKKESLVNLGDHLLLYYESPILTNWHSSQILYFFFLLVCWFLAKNFAY